VAVDDHAAFTEIGDAADDADQRRLACAVRPEQCEYLAPANFEVDAFQRLES